MPRSEAFLAEAADRVMILDLMARYAWEIDHGDRARWAALFTPEGIFEVPAMSLRIEGRPALESFARTLHETMPGVHHVMSGSVIDLRGDFATHRCLLNEFTIAGETLTPSVQGRYEDELRFDGEAWRFAHRIVRVDFPGLAPL